MSSIERKWENLRKWAGKSAQTRNFNWWKQVKVTRKICTEVFAVSAILWETLSWFSRLGWYYFTKTRPKIKAELIFFDKNWPSSHSLAVFCNKSFWKCYWECSVKYLRPGIQQWNKKHTTTLYNLPSNLVNVHVL